MSGKIKGFAKGMAMGVTAGAVLGMVVRPRSRRRQVTKAARAVGDMIENVAKGLWG